MHVKLMEYIVAIAETNSITKAANRLFVTQSALDQQLLKLEKELGVRLFDRARGNLTLTEAGEVYVDYARRIILLKEEAYTVISDLVERSAGRLSIGLTPERGVGMFSAIYPHFYRSFPSVTITPREIGVYKQLEMIRDGSLDFGFVTVSERNMPLVGMDYLPILQEEFLLAVPLSHPLAAKAQSDAGRPSLIDLRLFQNDPFTLMFKESTQRTLIDPLFEQAGFHPNIILETASNHTLVSMVEKGLCCSILPDYYALASDKAACFRLEEHLDWQLVTVYKRGKYLSKASRFLIELATEYWRNRQAHRLHRIG